MKRFWLILLSLGLVMAFSASALAVDVKVTGEYFAAGMYLNNTNVNDEDTQGATANQSTAFFYQRLRVGTDFSVSPGLKLVTRFDAMERIWGGARTESSSTAADSYATASENENIAVDWAYIDYVSPIGTFDIGIMNYGATGTIFGNSSKPAARIKYNYSKAPFTIGVDYSKIADNSYSAVNNSADWTDADKNVYGIEGTYQWKDGKAGMKINYYRYADKRPASDYMKTYYLFTPYATAKIGPVALQAEFNYATGKEEKYDNGIDDIRMNQYSAWVDATANFAPIYVGASIAYISGNDSDTDEQEGGTLTGGNDWNPCLIMFNYYDVGNWVGPVSGYVGTEVTGPMTNAIFVQGRVGVKPVPELDAMLSISYAKTDEVSVSEQDKDYGWEVDLTGTYKITNNLSYMLGVGYLFTGDYFKAGYGNDVNDDYVIMNKLTLTF